MSRGKRDYVGLAAQVMAASVRDIEGPPPPPETEWALGYSHAIEQAITQRNCIPLLRMLDLGMPIHSLMLPALGDVIRSLDQGKKAGAPALLTAIQEAALVTAVKAKINQGLKVIDAQHQVSEDWRIGFRLVKRVWEARERQPWEPQKRSSPGSR